MGKESVLKNLDKTVVRKAFERARDEIDVPGASLVLIEEPYYQLALGVARDHFITSEPLNKTLGTQWVPEVEQFWLSTFKLDLSLMLVDKATGEGMAIRTNRVARFDDVVDLGALKHTPIRTLVQFSDHCDVHADFFGHYGVEEAFHFLGLAVAPKYKQRGVGTKIFQANINMFKHLGLGTVYVKGEGSSNFSKKIYENSGFEILYDQPYDKYTVDGELVIQNTGAHKSMKVYGRKVL